jgi:hypothetical protein
MAAFENYDTVWDHPTEWTDTLKTTSSMDSFLKSASHAAYLDDDVTISASLLLSSMTDSSELLTPYPLNNEHLNKHHSLANSITDHSGEHSLSLANDLLTLRGGNGVEPSTTKVWTIHEINRMMRSSTDPIGKFLSSLNIPSSTVLDLHLMDLLVIAPTKKREKVSLKQAMHFLSFIPSLCCIVYIYQHYYITTTTMAPLFPHHHHYCYIPPLLPLPLSLLLLLRHCWSVWHKTPSDSSREGTAGQATQPRARPCHSTTKKSFSTSD